MQPSSTVNSDFARAGLASNFFQPVRSLPLKSGRIPRGFISAAKMKPRGMRPLFNGKDLTGWKKFEANPARAKSEFTVEDGCIHLKNGPGDLQTEELFDNFILQLECRTNGPHLN